jgi:hypothetical protein
MSQRPISIRSQPLLALASAPPFRILIEKMVQPKLLPRPPRMDQSLVSKDGTPAGRGRGVQCFRRKESDAGAGGCDDGRIVA